MMAGRERIMIKASSDRKILLGYTNKLTVRPNETIEFKISSEESKDYTAQLVQLINGDIHSERANFREIEIDAPINGKYQGRKQVIYQGSCVVIEDVAPLLDLEEFTLVINFMPTTPEFDVQHLVSRWEDGAGIGWSLMITQQGQLAFHTVDNQQHSSMVVSDQFLKPKCWYQVSVRISWKLRSVKLDLAPLGITAGQPQYNGKSCVEGLIVGEIPKTEALLIIAAGFGGHDAGDRIIPAGCFNGKIEAPVIYSGLLTDQELARVFSGERPTYLRSRQVGDWDFSRGISSSKIYDCSPNGLNGYIHNLPTRAVKGSRWDGGTVDWTQSSDHYAAIHFHSDDLYDCGWQTDITYQLSDALRSGVYALRIRVLNGDKHASVHEEEYIPFYVAAPKRKPQAQIAFIVPTFTYMAYGNVDILETNREKFALSREEFYKSSGLGPGSEQYASMVAAHPEVAHSTYDRHVDGSPIIFSSWLRPLLNMRPKAYLCELGADLLFIDWLEEKGFEYDIITDDLIQNEGVRLLEDYKVLITGNHPEYPTLEQLDAIEIYLGRGGRFMYLGGNGYYWNTAVSSHLPATIEVRRGRAGTATSVSEVGEYYNQTTGKIGGLWRDLGRPPQKLFGVGFVGVDDGTSSYYRVLPKACNSRSDFIFEDVEDGIIGDFGVLGGGAAGQEIDRTNTEYGTPEHTLILAKSDNCNLLSSHYATEERALNCSMTEEYYLSETYGEVVFFETYNGGAVFSVGSMAWFGSLGHNNYDNNVSTITKNVLNRFVSPEPFIFPV